MYPTWDAAGRWGFLPMTTWSTALALEAPIQVTNRLGRSLIGVHYAKSYMPFELFVNEH